MKKPFHCIMKNDGFILLHVLFVVSLLFILVSGGAAVYRNEVYITHRQIEQIKIETLFQMAREQYKTESRDADELLDDVIYHFPYGEVKITIFDVTETYLKLNFVIRFPESDFYFPIDHLFVLD